MPYRRRHLSAAPALNYSPLERKVFHLLSKVPKSTSDLTEAVYKDLELPNTARQAVLSAANKLALKVKLNREPFKVHKSKRRGPYPVEFWVEDTP